jgi:ribosomal protein S18 acetylase RimI-like enzyme
MHGMDDARQLFLDQGLTLIRHFWRMVIELEDEPAAPQIPAGIHIRPMRRNEEERRVIQAMRDSFKDHWGYIEGPFEDEYERWMHFLNGTPDFDPDLWLMALDGNQVAGISLNWKFIPGEPDLGWVGTLGVLRPWRKRGLGLALLQQSFLELYRRGQRKVGLGVDASSLTNATRLYEKAGMRSDPRFQMEMYELELRPGVDLSTQSAPE